MFHNLILWGSFSSITYSTWYCYIFQPSLPLPYHDDFTNNLLWKENIINEIIDIETQDEPLNVS